MSDPFEATSLLRLLQISDSAIPIGGAAHSFGLEMMAAMGWIEGADLAVFLNHYLEEAGLSDAIFCRAAYGGTIEELGHLCNQLSALRTSQELRTASTVMGRRLLRLVAACEPLNALTGAFGIDNLHHTIAFGFIAGVLQIEMADAVHGYLHQSVGAIVSAAQRLLPVGQQQASQLLWRLKPKIAQIAQRSAGRSPDQALTFAPMLEIASMRHKRLETRLFIS